MDLSLTHKPRILIMMSRFDHALLHLFYQVRVDWLDAEVADIVSNQLDVERIADHEGFPFYHYPVNRATKVEVETRLLDVSQVPSPASNSLIKQERTGGEYQVIIHPGSISNMHF